MRKLWELDNKNQGGAPFTSGGTLATPTSEISIADGVPLISSAYRTGGTNSSGSDKSIADTVYLPYDAASAFLLKAALKCDSDTLNWEDLSIQLDVYDGTNRVLFGMQIDSGENLTQEIDFIDSAGNWTNVAAFDAIFPSANRWSNLEMLLTKSGEAYTSVLMNGLQSAVPVGYTAASAASPYIGIVFGGNFETGQTVHFILGMCELWAID